MMFRARCIAGPIFTAVFSSCLLVAPVAFADEMIRLEAREWGLPSFQERELARDLPIQGMLQGPDQSVWLLGRSALWHWNLNTNGLQRILLLWEDRILEPAKNPEQLVRLGTDGASIFVGSTRFVYQVGLEDSDASAKVMRYKIPQGSKNLPVGFVGSGDRFFWITTGQAFVIDRYGKKLNPVPIGSGFLPTDGLLTDLSDGGILISRDKQIWKAPVTKGLKGEVALGKALSVQKVSNPVLGMTGAADGYIAHTAFTVMRMDWTGKRMQTIPVENDRRLKKISMDEQRHSYLFEDGLVEVFDMNSQSARRFQIPAEVAASSTFLVMANESNMLVITEGKIKAYSLARGVASPRISRK